MKKLLLPLLSATLLFACSTQKENEQTAINQTVQKGLGTITNATNNHSSIAVMVNNTPITTQQNAVYKGIPAYYQKPVSIQNIQDLKPNSSILPVSEAVCLNPACAFMDTLCDKQLDNGRQELILSIANSKGGFIEYFEAKPVLNTDRITVDEFTISFKTICIDKSAFDSRNAWLRKSDYGVN